MRNKNLYTFRLAYILKYKKYKNNYLNKVIKNVTLLKMRFTIEFSLFSIYSIYLRKF